MSAVSELIDAGMKHRPGLSVKSIAEAVGVSTTIIYRWKSAESQMTEPPAPERVAALARVLEVPQAVMWQAVLKDCGADVELVPSDIDPDLAILIEQTKAVPVGQRSQVAAIVSTFVEQHRS